MYAVCFLTALFACVGGKICGMGGGVIIKPVLDSLGIMSVTAISFLSGCTVAGMSCWSVGKSVLAKDSAINWRLSTPLSIGAAVGGLLGKELFLLAERSAGDADTVGGVQAAILFAATLATLLYTIFKDRIPSRRVEKRGACLAIGLGLGLLGSFLGIGGGPFNMAVLYYFFSMATKPAAQNSLYVILISQTASILKTVLSGSVPAVDLPLLAGMIACGVIGSELGGRLNKRLSERQVTVLFMGFMVLVLGINAYNICKFF